jgi:hypothetical protein
MYPNCSVILSVFLSSSQRCIHNHSLLAQPTLWHVLSTLKYKVIALQPAREIVPRRRYHGVFAREVLYQGFVRRL